MRDFHNYLVTSPTIDGEWSDPGLSQQQRLRSVALPRRRWPEVSPQHALGSSARAQSLRRNRVAGILGPRAQAHRRRVNIFEGTPLGFTEGAASLQARRLVLPAHGRRRHQLESRRDDGALAQPHRSIRTASRHLHLSARHRPDAESAARRPRRPRRNAERRNLHGLSRAAGRCAIAAAARSVARRRFRKWSGARTAGCARWTDRGFPTAGETPAPDLPGAPVSGRRRDARISTRRSCPSISNGCARRGRRKSSASPRVRVICGSSAAKRSAACSGNRSSRGGSSRIASAPPRSSNSSRNISSRLAGLVCYYNSTKFHYLYLSHDETIGKHLRVMSCAAGLQCRPTPSRRPSPSRPASRVHLRVEVDYERLHFAYRVEGVDADWRWLPQQFDASILSDEATAPGLPNFTGAFVGMACQDMAGTACPRTSTASNTRHATTDPTHARVARASRARRPSRPARSGRSALAERSRLRQAPGTGPRRHSPSIRRKTFSFGGWSLSRAGRRDGRTLS